MKHITHILNDFPTYSQTFIYQQIKNQVDDNLKISIISDFNPGQSIEQPIINKYQLKKNNVYYNSDFSRFKQAVGETLDTTDIFHCHFINNAINLNKVRKLLRFKQPVVTTPYGVDIMTLQDKDSLSYLNHPKYHFIAICNSIKEKLEFLGIDRNKISLIPLSVDLNKFTYLHHKKNPHITTFTTISRFVDKKGIDLSIQAFAKIRREYPDMKFRYQIYGSGPKLQELLNLIKNHSLEKYISIKPALDHDNIKSVFIDTDYFILCSRTSSNGDAEGLPAVIQESQAFGIPVISTHHAGIPEEVIHEVTGYLAKENDIDDISKCIKKAIRTDTIKYTKLSNNARKFMKEKFDNNVIKEKAKNLYKTIITQDNYHNFDIDRECYLVNPNKTIHNSFFRLAGKKYYLDPILYPLVDHGINNQEGYFIKTNKYAQADTIITTEENYQNIVRHAPNKLKNGVLLIIFSYQSPQSNVYESFALREDLHITDKLTVSRFFLIKKQNFNIKFPLISILMPTYNGREFISRAIKSALFQTYRNFELIIICDGGDDVSDIVNTFHDKRIKYYRINHSGKAAALNYGIKKSCGSLISYLDDDDYYYPRHLEELFLHLQKTNKQVVYSDNYEIRQLINGTIYSFKIENKIDVKLTDLLLNNLINHQAILHTKYIFKSIGYYDEELGALIDYDFISRIFIKFKVDHLKSALSEHNLYFNNNTIVNRITGLIERDYTDYQLSRGKILKRIWLSYIKTHENIEILIDSIYDDYLHKEFTINYLNNKLKKKQAILKTENDWRIKYERLYNECLQAAGVARKKVNKEEKFLVDENLKLIKAINNEREMVLNLENAINKIKYSKFFSVWQLYCRLRDKFKSKH